MDDGIFSVCLFNEPNTADSGTASKTATLVDSRLLNLRQHFLQNPTLNNADYRGIFKVGRYSAARELRRLVEDGFLRMEGKGRGAHYVPQPSLNVGYKRAK